MFKRALAVLLAVLLMGSILAGCNGDGDQSGTTSTPGGDTSISGDITYAVVEGSEVDAQAVIDAFGTAAPQARRGQRRPDIRI